MSIRKLFLMLLVVFALVGCSQNNDYDELQEEDEVLDKNEVLEEDEVLDKNEVLEEDENKIIEDDTDNNDVQQDIESNEDQNNIPTKVKIIGYYEEPNSIHDEDTIILEGVLEGEFVEVDIKGEIFEFEDIRLEWDSETEDLVEVEVIHKIDSLKDQKVIIKTYMPEGIASEKIRWKSQKGEITEFIINENGKDGPVWEFNVQ